MRLFFAVELPADVQAVLGRLRPGGDNRDYRWSDPALLHVTLAFLGEQPEDSLAALAHIGGEAAGAGRTGRLRLGEAGSFGGRRSPRVLWVDLGGDVDRLLELHLHLETGLRQGGFPTEDRPFRAHITLARRRETARGGAPIGWPPPEVEHAAFSLQVLTLMHSRLNPHGPTYTPVAKFPIGG
jgi:2'-5' RNA ligase